MINAEIDTVEHTVWCRKSLARSKPTRLSSEYSHCHQSLRVRGYATVSDAPLDKKVEMTNWEKVRSSKVDGLSVWLIVAG